MIVILPVRIRIKKEVYGLVYPHNIYSLYKFFYCAVFVMFGTVEIFESFCRKICTDKIIADVVRPDFLPSISSCIFLQCLSTIEVFHIQAVGVVLSYA